MRFIKLKRVRSMSLTSKSNKYVMSVYKLMHQSFETPTPPHHTPPHPTPPRESGDIHLSLCFPEGWGEHSLLLLHSLIFRQLAVVNERGIHI